MIYSAILSFHVSETEAAESEKATPSQPSNSVLNTIIDRMKVSVSLSSSCPTAGVESLVSKLFSRTIMYFLTCSCLDRAVLPTLNSTKSYISVI